VLCIDDRLSGDVIPGASRTKLLHDLFHYCPNQFFKIVSANTSLNKNKTYPNDGRAHANIRNVIAAAPDSERRTILNSQNFWLKHHLKIN